MNKIGYLAIILLVASGAFLAGTWYSGRETARVSPPPANPGLVAGEAADDSLPATPGAVKISAARQQLIAVRVAEVEKKPASHSLRLLGRVAADETRVSRINATVDGWIQKALGPGTWSASTTLGFRGEALASIASVCASVEVKTKTRGSISGSYLRMEDGKIKETKEIGSPVGTTITVRDLFYKVPARREHLLGAEAEAVHIADVITEMAIIHHDISFELFSGKRTIFKSIRSPSWDDVLLRLFGLKTLKGMTGLQAHGRGWSLSGLIGDTLAARSSADRIFIFVNGRAINSRALSSALREAYRNIIPQGKSPADVISCRSARSRWMSMFTPPKERSASCMRRRSPRLSPAWRQGLCRSTPGQPGRRGGCRKRGGASLQSYQLQARRQFLRKAASRARCPSGRRRSSRSRSFKALRTIKTKGFNFLLNEHWAFLGLIGHKPIIPFYHDE